MRISSLAWMELKRIENVFFVKFLLVFRGTLQAEGEERRPKRI